MALLEQLAELLQRDPSDRREHARWHLLDWFACAVGARDSALAHALARLAAPDGTTESLSVIGPMRSPEEALRVNSALGNVLEMDDVHRTSILHPGPVVVPAALAAAIEGRASLDGFLDAIVRGFDAVIRVGRALDAEHYRFFHTTSTAGAFGAASAAGSLFGLDTPALAQALALAGTRTGGLWQVRHGGMGKSWHNALAAESGLAAARWARVGVTGPLAVLEGPQGLFAATCSAPRPERLIEDAPWWIDDVSFKPWPACRHAHATIDAALLVRAAMAQRSPTQIRTVEIASYGDALTFCNRAEPQNEAEAKFSLQHCAAVVLALGLPEALHFRQPFLRDRRVAALRAATTTRRDGNFDAAYPEHYGARVEVELHSGERLFATVRDALGDPANPLDSDALTAKAATLITDVGIDDRNADALIEHILAAPGELPTGDWYREALSWTH